MVLFQRLAIPAFILSLLLGAGSANADEDERGDSVVRLSATAGYHTSIGDYGNDIETRITYIPFIAKAKYEGWTVKVTIPYLQISGPNTVIGAGEDIVSGQVGSVVRKTHSGLGDVVIGLGYTFNLAKRTNLNLTGKVKLPTADEDRNLGTGKFDYTVETQLSHSFKNRISVSAKLGRTFKGTPQRLDLHDLWRGGAGVGYSFGQGTNLGMNYDYHQSASDGGKPYSQVTAYVGQSLNQDWSAQLYSTKGFTEGTADYGGGLMIARKF